MFKIFKDQKNPDSLTPLREKIFRLEKELKIAQRQDAYQFVATQMASFSSPFCPLVAAMYVYDNHSKHLSKEINSLKHELSMKEKALSDCAGHTAAKNGVGRSFV